MRRKKEKSRRTRYSISETTAQAHKTETRNSNGYKKSFCISFCNLVSNKKGYADNKQNKQNQQLEGKRESCLLYTSPSPRDS